MKIIILTVLFLAFHCPSYAENPQLINWENFKKFNITEDGRVVDRQAGKISHSEGQGYALVMAVHYDDKELFKKLSKWSDDNLGEYVRSWEWGYNADNKKWQIIDENNATDGDLLHAWAFLKAGEKWDNKDYTDKGKMILYYLKMCCVTKDGILLPGKAGFVKPEGYILNPSYYIFPALQDFVVLDTDNTLLWQKTIDMGLHIIKKSINPKNGLPSDWVLFKNSKVIVPYPETYVFGYEAIRIGLYLSIAGLSDELLTYTNIINYVYKNKSISACISNVTLDYCTEEAGYSSYAIMARIAKDIKLVKEEKEIRNIYLQKDADITRYYDAILSIFADTF